MQYFVCRIIGLHRRRRGRRRLRWRGNATLHPLQEQGHFGRVIDEKLSALAHHRCVQKPDLLECAGIEFTLGIQHSRDGGKPGVAADLLQQGQPILAREVEFHHDALIRPVAQRRQRLGRARYRVECAIRTRERGHDGVALDQVALDQQQHVKGSLHRRGQLGKYFGQGRKIGRFGGIAGHPVAGAALRPVAHRNDMHGDVAGQRFGLEAIRDIPSIHIGQFQVERDGVRPLAPGQLETLLAGARHQRVEATVVRHVLQRAREHRIVFDNQQQRIGIARRAWRGVDGRRLAAHGRRLRPGAYACQLLRQIEGEGAADSLLAGDVELAVQQAGNFAADCQPQAGAAVTPRRAGVGLLECLEDQPHFICRDADATVAHAEGDDQRRVRKARVGGIPALAGNTRRQADAALAGEFERVRQQVGQYLLEALAVGAQDRRQGVRKIDGKYQPLGLGLVAEPLVEVAGQLVDVDIADLERGAARFNLRQVEDIVNQMQQVVAGSVHHTHHVDLLLGQVAVAVLAQLFGQQQQAVERRAQLMRHVGEKFGLVLRRQRELLRLFLQAVAGNFDFAILGFDFGILLGQLARLALQFGISLAQRGLLRLEFAFQLLRLLPQQQLRPGGSFDRIEHDAEAFGQLVEEVQVDRLERLEGGQFDHRLDLVLEQDGQHDDVARAGLAEA